ncbi:PH domain-containing protein [Phenylobacterium sp.]|jgi:hypothetical protein|uniref:PH domain-containing protein n=1 Tax=Phenylobacterium sp. TaxID=1871053 RepID=UPI002E3552F3|nr:PH domain-containing protein [Phenylobacterium sp.]HEX4712335.1 PH domain-containing protein [Phenylobacterium sp.]
MSDSYDLQHGPLTLVQQRGKAALAGLVALGFVAVGVWLLTAKMENPRAALAGALSIAFFGWVSARTLVALVRPNRLTVEQAGLTLETPFRTQRWSWADLAAIDLLKVRRTEVITFRSRTASRLSGGVYAALGLSGNSGLPGGWPIGTRELFALLSQAKARWG